MTNKLLSVLVLGLAGTLAGQAQTTTAPTRVGIINIQGAIASTKDGQKAANEMRARFAPKKAELEKRQGEISDLQTQVTKGRNTLSEEARQSLAREIDTKTKAINRFSEDAQAEVDQEQRRIMSELGGKILAVIDKYARENGFSLILDVSSQQTPVLYASGDIDITKEIVALYDKNVPAASASAPAAPAPASTAPRPPAAASPKKPPAAAPPK